MPHPGGRPTKYRKEYCDRLIRHMAQGLSYESFAGLVKVNVDTLYEWESKHKEFSDAKKRGFQQNRLFWERKGIQGLTYQARTPFNSAVWIFNMKNRFPKEWRDTQELKHSGDINITWNEQKNYAADDKTD